MVAFAFMGFQEKNGRWPFLKAKAAVSRDSESESESQDGSVATVLEHVANGKTGGDETAQPATIVRELGD